MRNFWNFIDLLLNPILRAITGIIEDEVSLRASSLAYSVLFSVAPIGALILGLMHSFPALMNFLPELYDKVIATILPGSLTEITKTINTFANNATNLSIVSLSLAIISMLFLSMQLETCVDKCWGLPKKSQLNPLAKHWMALTLAPCAMVLLGWIVYNMVTVADATYVSLGLLYLFFLTVIGILPSSNPPAWAVIVAALMATINCWLIQIGFTYVWSQTQSYGIIYGTAAVILGSLLWIWLFWLAMLSSVSLIATWILKRERNLYTNGFSWYVDFMTQKKSPVIKNTGDEEDINTRI